MKNIFCIICLFIIGNTQSQSIQSPSQEILLDFKVLDNGKPTYKVFYKNNPIILESLVGIKLKVVVFDFQFYN